MLATAEIERLKKELSFKTSRSGGKGGQNVNKVETKVELLFDVNASESLNISQKQSVLTKLKSRIDDNGILHLSEDGSRSQLKNKDEVIERFIALLNQAFVKQKVRKATKPSKSSKMKRVDSKKRKGELKQWRKKPF
ncbi:MAG: alternative ribosome rescue aminoacyl-tRNA hydrolase ArfB [Bacteroidia bacterium]